VLLREWCPHLADVIQEVVALAFVIRAAAIHGGLRDVDDHVWVRDRVRAVADCHLVLLVGSRINGSHDHRAYDSGHPRTHDERANHMLRHIGLSRKWLEAPRLKRFQ